VFPGKESVPGAEYWISGLDFILIVRGLMARDDEDFLLKKRDFVTRCVFGDTDLEKVTHFRLLKESYRNTPFLYVTDQAESQDGKIAQRIHEVRTVSIAEGNLETLLGAIDRMLG
jgi:hypothetical protein